MSASELFMKSFDTSKVYQDINKLTQRLFDIGWRLSLSNQTKSERNDNIISYQKAVDVVESCRASLDSMMKDAASSFDLNFSVPKDLPFFQQYDKVVDPFKHVYSTATEFCDHLERVLLAHGLDIDKVWYRLLPLCLQPSQMKWYCVSWPTDPRIDWSVAASRIKEHYAIGVSRKKNTAQDDLDDNIVSNVEENYLNLLQNQLSIYNLNHSHGITPMYIYTLIRALSDYSEKSATASTSILKKLNEQCRDIAAKLYANELERFDALIKKQDLSVNLGEE
ncbi:hypothetical protein BY458DRAFT_558021 [Sporodiniella umbellata]|nr:hypothetical protein BY458DRAFT_558021 [Sporodiniella umbellata]